METRWEKSNTGNSMKKPWKEPWKKGWTKGMRGRRKDTGQATPWEILEGCTLGLGADVGGATVLTGQT
jgi:hypothetical protein